MTEAQELAAKAAALRDQSDALNLAMHADGVTEDERQEFAAKKRPIDAEAFDLEQRVRALEEAAYDGSEVSESVLAPPININGGGA